eukprot:gene12913-8770_t
MWDALHSKDRSLGVRYPSRPSAMNKRSDNVLRNSDIQGGLSEQSKASHPYGLEVGCYAPSDGPAPRDYGPSYSKPGSTYSFIQTRSEDRPRPVASPYRRVSSNCVHGGSPKAYRPSGTPPKLNVRTSSDAAQLPKPLVWTRSSAGMDERRVSTDHFISPDQPSIDCKCPEIYYTRTRGAYQTSKNQSPLQSSKKKYVFSPRDSTDGNEHRDSHGIAMSTPNKRNPYPPFNGNSRPESTNGSTPGSTMNRRTTPLKIDKDPTMGAKVGYRASDPQSGSRLTHTPLNTNSQPVSIVAKRISSDKGLPQSRRASNPAQYESTPSTISSMSEHVEHHGSSSTGGVELSRGQQVDPSGTNKLLASQVKLLVAQKTSSQPGDEYTDSASDAKDQVGKQPQLYSEGSTKKAYAPSPVRVLESTISSFSGSEDVPSRSAPLYNFVSTRNLLASFMHRWKNKYEENKNAYYDGGYLKVTRGSLVENRYVVIQKLGWGEFSTVWLAYDTRYYAYKRTARESFVALKIAKCHRSVAENTAYEINLLRYLCARLPECPMTKLLDSFSISGEFGSHLCMVMPLHGANLLSIIDQMKAAKRHRTAEEIRMIKEVIASTLTGLHELSTINVIHTDIKPENIIATSPDPKVVEMMQSFSRHNSKSPKRRVVSVEELTECMTAGDPNHLVCLADFGLSASLDTVQRMEQCNNSNIRSLMARVVGCKKQFPVSTPGVMRNRCGTIIQTREYRAPEVIFGMDFNCQTDVWSVGCTAYELITGSFLMNPKKRSANERHMNVEHIAMMMQLIGDIPPEITALRTRHNSFFEARDKGQNVALPEGVPVYIDRFIDARGRFLYADRYRNYERRRLDVELEPFLPSNEANMAASFILTCLHSFDPKHRPTAKDMLQHPWLRDVFQHTPPYQFYFTANCLACFTFSIYIMFAPIITITIIIFFLIAYTRNDISCENSKDDGQESNRLRGWRQGCSPRAESNTAAQLLYLLWCRTLSFLCPAPTSTFVSGTVSNFPSDATPTAARSVKLFVSYTIFVLFLFFTVTLKEGESNNDIRSMINNHIPTVSQKRTTKGQGQRETSENTTEVRNTDTCAYSLLDLSAHDKMTKLLKRLRKEKKRVNHKMANKNSTLFFPAMRWNFRTYASAVHDLSGSGKVRYLLLISLIPSSG